MSVLVPIRQACAGACTKCNSLNPQCRVGVLDLPPDEAIALFEALSDPRFQAGAADDQDRLIDVAARVAEDYRAGFPSLSAQISTLRRDIRPNGLVVINSLPVVHDSQRTVAVVGAILGRLTRFADEGNYIIAIKEQLTQSGDRPSFANSRPFFLHIDRSYAPEPPEYFGMHAVWNNQGEGGRSTFCDINLATRFLTPEVLHELQLPNFLFPAPAHCRGGERVCESILTQDGDGWRVRFRRDNLASKTRAGIEAVIALIQAMNRATFEMMLSTNSIVLINNRTFLHGRTAFVASGDAHTPRHLNRAYISSH